MRRNGDKTTSGVKFDLRFAICRKKFENWTTISCILANFQLRMRRNGQISTSGRIFNPKFEIAMIYFLFEYEFWWSFRQDLYVFCAKNCFRNAKFWEFGGYWGWGEIFLSKLPKGTSLPDFTRFESSIVQICSRVFAPGECTKKRDTIQKVTERLYFTYLRGIPQTTKFNQNWHTIGVTDIINHTKVDNDRSRKYKVTEGRILACSIGMACRL